MGRRRPRGPDGDDGGGLGRRPTTTGTCLPLPPESGIGLDHSDVCDPLRPGAARTERASVAQPAACPSPPRHPPLSLYAPLVGGRAGDLASIESIAGLADPPPSDPPLTLAVPSIRLDARAAGRSPLSPPSLCSLVCDAGLAYEDGFPATRCSSDMGVPRMLGGMSTDPSLSTRTRPVLDLCTDPLPGTPPELTRLPPLLFPLPGPCRKYGSSPATCVPAPDTSTTSARPPPPAFASACTPDAARTSSTSFCGTASALNDRTLSPGSGAAGLVWRACTTIMAITQQAKRNTSAMASRT